MLNEALRQDAKIRQQMGWLLVFVLIFAALHVALHDLDISPTGLEHHDECQVCRLNHVPLASLPVPDLHTPLRLLLYKQAFISTTYLFSYPPYSRQARAPPLF